MTDEEFDNDCERAQAHVHALAEMQDRRDEQARWERFFVAALGGLAMHRDVRDPEALWTKLTVEAASVLADWAVSHADARAEAKRRAGADAGRP